MCACYTDEQGKRVVCDPCAAAIIEGLNSSSQRTERPALPFVPDKEAMTSAISSVNNWLTSLATRGEALQ